MSATPKQMEILIAFMDEHPDLAKGYKPNSHQGKQDINKMWADLAAALNADGLPTKSVQAWRKVWTDFKYRAKKKCSQNLLSLKKTGGGPSEEVHISEQEEKAIQMTSLRAAVSGSSANVFGASSNKLEVNDIEEALRGLVESPRNEDDPTEELFQFRKRRSTPYITASTPKRTKENDTVEHLLRTQIEKDSDFQSNVVSILRERNEIMRERNQEEAFFHANAIRLLERRNDLAAKKL